MLEFILNKLKQPSSWRGIIALLAAGGVTLSPDLIEAIIACGLGAVGLIEVARNE